LVAQGKSVLDAGGTVVQILESYGGNPATRANLDAWVTKYAVVTTTLLDTPAGTGTKTLSVYGMREQVFIVEMKTMKIVKKISGSVFGPPAPSSITQAVPIILGLLAK
jgi:hypothetical protein